jgi:transglutaminase-like putative cysteine protease
MIVLGMFFTQTSPAQADENFAISLHSTYTVTQSGSTIVEQKFTLKNKKPTLFAKQYAVEFGSSKLKNVRVFDDKGQINANVVNNENKTSIGITFDDKIVGEGKGRSFTIRFETADSAIITGNILEVYVPRLSNAKEYESYSVTLRTPARYGQPVRVTPHTYAVSATDSMVVLDFAQVANQSISALFGEKQVYHYRLNYELDNPTNSVGIIQVALPPDTGRQKIEYSSLEPTPKDIQRDEDGNWIATYEIAAQKNLDVIVTGKAIVTLEPDNTLNLAKPSANYLGAQKYWETEDARIKDLAQKYSTPKDIYDYVTGVLSYNYSKVNGDATRLGAAAILNDPKNAVCQEFTDLFIAISRAAGIPARRATGYAFTENSRLRPLSLVEDVLHAWPEYYDSSKNDWIPIDPTWGHTTGGINYFDQFDFNHLVFAINGASSSTPYPAGAYKRTEQPTKNVFVEFGTDATISPVTLSTTVSRKTDFWSLITRRYSVEVTNSAGVAAYNIPLHFTTDALAVNIQPEETTLDYILPFQTRTIEIQVSTQQWYKPQPFDLTVSVQGLSSTHALQAGLTIRDFSHSPFITIGVVSCVGFIIFFTWRLLVSRRPGYRSVRR